MKFLETKIKGAFLLEPEKREDERGMFARTWCERECRAQGLPTDFVQFNVSRTKKAGTIRGLHYQIAPHVEAKLIRCIRGGIYDVIVDVRPHSPTYAQWVGIELMENDLRSLFIPEGVAHGFQTLRDQTEVFYPVTEYYSPESERGIRWNDPYFKIAWPLTATPTVSVKDQQWPEFSFDE
jgi:dTDP-4-dehydrorhamnose 3,5-epimerase